MAIAVKRKTGADNSDSLTSRVLRTLCPMRTRKDPISLSLSLSLLFIDEQLHTCERCYLWPFSKKCVGCALAARLRLCDCLQSALLSITLLIIRKSHKSDNYYKIVCKFATHQIQSFGRISLAAFVL